MSEVKLKPCPFCGGEAIYETIEKDSFGEEMPVIFCNWCKVVFKAEDDSPFLSYKERYKYLEEKNAKSWNTRKPMERIVERLELERTQAEKSMRVRGFINNPLQFERIDSYLIAMDDAIDIVKEGGNHETK